MLPAFPRQSRSTLNGDARAIVLHGHQVRSQKGNCECFYASRRMFVEILWDRTCRGSDGVLQVAAARSQARFRRTRSILRPCVIDGKLARAALGLMHAPGILIGVPLPPRAERKAELRTFVIVRRESLLSNYQLK